MRDSRRIRHSGKRPAPDSIRGRNPETGLGPVGYPSRHSGGSRNPERKAPGGVRRRSFTKLRATWPAVLLLTASCNVTVELDANPDLGGESALSIPAGTALAAGPQNSEAPLLNGPAGDAAAANADDEEIHRILDALSQVPGDDEPTGEPSPPTPQPQAPAGHQPTATTPNDFDIGASAPATGSSSAPAVNGSDTTTTTDFLADAGDNTTLSTPSTTSTTLAGNVAEPLPAEDLPGEPYEWGPAAGTSLAVVGVDYDDVLNVRDVPFGDIIATLGLANPIAFLLEVRAMPSGEPIDWFDSWSGAIVATGRTRKLPTTVWHEVQVAGVTGWASGAYLAPIGLTEDFTAHLIDRLGGRPVADTLTDLAFVVGEALASSEPQSRVVVTVGPIIFEGLGEVAVDVLNIGDDSLLGFRLHIFATPAAEDWMSEDPGPFTLRTVERTVLCRADRGVTADGLCR